MSSDQGHKVRTLWLVGILHAFTHVYMMALVPLYLLIKADLRLASDGTAPLLVTVMGIAYYIPSYPMGVLADRVSRRKLLALGLAINGLGFMALAWSPNFACALVAVSLAGFGGSFYHPAATALVARLYPVGTGKALGLAAIGASAGFCISPIYAGWRAEMTGNWRAPILELGIAGLIFAGIFYWLASEEKIVVTEKKSAAPKEKLFPTSALWIFFLSASFFFMLRDFAGSGMGSLVSLFLQQAHGFNPKTTGVILSGIFLASVGSSPVFGRLSDNGRVKWAAFLLICSAILVALFPHASRGMMFVTLMTYGFFFLASYPIVEAALMESVPDSVRGRVFGLFITTGGLLGNVAHWAVGVAVQKLGSDAANPRAYYPIYGALAVTMALSLIGLPCLHAIRKREGLEPHVMAGATRAIPGSQSAVP